MDRQETRRQMQVLRNKLYSRRANTNPPTVRNGVVQFNKPVERRPTLNINPPTPAQIRLKRAEKLLEQRQHLMALKNEQPAVVPMQVDAGKPKPQPAQKPGNGQKKSRGGCGGCRRKGR